MFGTGLRRPEEMQNHQVYIHDVLGMMDRVDYFDAQQFIRENDTKRVSINGNRVYEECV